MADPATAAQSTPAADVIAELETAYRRVRTIESEIDDHGEDNVEAAADAYRNATRLLDRYEDSATGTGDFKAYLQFQNEFIALAEGLSDDALAAEAFQRASDRMDKRRLNESDFDYAREQTEAAAEAVDLLERREEAHSAYRQARHDAKARKDELDAEADRLRRVRELGGVDLDIPLDPLQEPVEAYNAAVREAFDEFRRTESARALFELLAAGADRPLVDADRPPRDLAEYIESAPRGRGAIDDAPGVCRLLAVETGALRRRSGRAPNPRLGPPDLFKSAGARTATDRVAARRERGASGPAPGTRPARPAARRGGRPGGGGVRCRRRH